jgi:hypothetical protein
MSSSPKGYPTQKKDDLIVGPQFATVQPLDGDKYGLDVHAVSYVRLVASDAVEASSTPTLINATAHLAKVGDIIRMTSGATDGQEVRVIKVETNSIHVTALSVAPTAADTFDILRHTAPLVDSSGKVEVIASLAPSPIQFVLDGVDTEVEEDTAVPANSLPLPVKVLDSSGAELDFATEAKQDLEIIELQAIKTAVELIDNTVSGSELQVDIVASLPAGTNNIGDVDVVSSALPTGAATSALQTSSEAILTTIDADTSILAGTVAGSELQVDIVASLPAGTNNIGDVDVLSLPAIPAGTNTIGAVNLNTLDIVDFIDTTPVLDASVTTINGSAGAFVTLVASTAADVKRIQVLDTTGAFLGLYTGAAASEVLKIIIGPGSDLTTDCVIPSGTRVSVRRLDSSTNVTAGNLAINFLG